LKQPVYGGYVIYFVTATRLNFDVLSDKTHADSA